MRAPRCLSRRSPVLLCLTVGLSNAASAYPDYRVTVVGPVDSTATAINNDGVVVGGYPYSATARHAFLTRGKGQVDLGTLGGTSSNAVAINDKRQVLGHWISSAGQQRGLIYYAGKHRDSGVLPGRLTTYTGINNNGFITASGTLPDSMEDQRGFLRALNGAFTDIGSLPYDSPITDANGLNNRNQVTGASGPLLFPEQPYRAFIWTKGVMRDLGDLGWAPNYAQAINDCGQVTGSMAQMNGFHNSVAFLYSHGRLINIDRRPASVERDSGGTVYPHGINDHGQIAATATRGGVQYAVRLDLIRPLLEQAPALEPDAEAAPAPATVDPAQVKADAEARTREVVQAVAQ